MAERDFDTIPDVFDAYGEPCNNCTRYCAGSFCQLGHRQKRVGVNTGHIPELTVRRASGCPDHKIMEGVWWGEDPIKPHQSGYGGSSTNLLL